MKAFAENPLLAHSLRMRFWRDPRPAARVVRVAAGSAYGLMLLVMLIGMVWTSSVGDALRIVFFVGLTMVFLFVPIFLAPQFAGERERRTWDDIIVTPLTPRELVEGKLLGGMYWVGLLLLSWSPFVVVSLFLPRVVDPGTNPPLKLSDVAAVLGMLLVVAVTAWAVAGLTLLRSMLTTRTFRAMAQVWVAFIGVLALTWAIAEVLKLFTYGSYSYSGSRSPLSEVIAAVNPYVLVQEYLLPVVSRAWVPYASPPTSFWEAQRPLLGYALIYGLTGLLCLRPLLRRLRALDRQVRERR